MSRWKLIAWQTTGVSCASRGQCVILERSAGIFHPDHHSHKREMKEEGAKRAGTVSPSLLEHQTSNTHQPIFNPLQPIIPNPLLILQQ